MLKINYTKWKLVVLCVLCVFLLVPVIGFAAESQIDEASTAKVFIPYGSTQETLGVINKAPGIQPEAPLSFFVNGNTYGILDTIKKRIAIYTSGTFTKEIKLNYTNYPKDVILVGDNLYIFDEGDNYQVYKINMDGKILQVYTVNIPGFDFSKNALKWLTVTKNGAVAITDCDYKEYELDDSNKGVKGGVKGISSSGIGFMGKKGQDGKMRLLSTDNKKEVLLDINCISAGAEIVGSDSKGNIYVKVGDKADTSKVIIESTVRKFDKNGNQLGIARLPLEECNNDPTRSVYVTPSGDVYFMALKENGVEIKELALNKSYDSTIKEKELKQKSIESQETVKPSVNSVETSSITPASVSNSRQTTNDRAYQINSLYWGYNSYNNVPPAGATRPDWLTSYGNKTGIPYCWGGFDANDRSSSPSSWSNFVDAMNKQKFAGNVNCTGSYKAGTAGLDCSGYVGACLGYTWKPNTVNLWDNSIQVSQATWMDSYNDKYTHVLFFMSILPDGTGVVSSECTTSGDDKCKIYSRTYSFLNNNGYQCRTFW